MTRPVHTWLSQARSPGAAATADEEEYGALRRDALGRGEIESTEWLVIDEPGVVVYVDRDGGEVSFITPARGAHTQEGEAVLACTADGSAYVLLRPGQPGRVFRAQDSDGVQVPVHSLRQGDQDLVVNWPRTHPPRKPAFSLRLEAWDVVLEQWVRADRAVPPVVQGEAEALAAAAALVDDKASGVDRVVILRRGVEAFVVEPG